MQPARMVGYVYPKKMRNDQVFKIQNSCWSMIWLGSCILSNIMWGWLECVIIHKPWIHILTNQCNGMGSEQIPPAPIRDSTECMLQTQKEEATRQACSGIGWEYGLIAEDKKMDRGFKGDFDIQNLGFTNMEVKIRDGSGWNGVSYISISYNIIQTTQFAIHNLKWFLRILTPPI